MYLEKIEIFGFKSFADKTVLHFNQPITSIVGPNGCGKSNVVDAFRWVLGEGSAKSLRSEKMVDVIFSGSSKRQPLNYAQISLTFTNVKNSISLGFDELCIARRIHRNGESEWLINKNPVRLKDLHKVLWEAGMGKNAFYIFEQGKVDQLITSTPLERRVIFEEAAKIMLFKEKKREALRKLSQVEENLKRVLDIQSEVEKQIEKLSKQAEEAQIYTQNRAALKTLEEGLFVAKWQHFHKKQKNESEKQSQNLAEQQQQREELDRFEKELEHLKRQQEKLTLETKKAYESFFEEKKVKELATFELSIHEKKSKELSAQIESLKSQLKEMHQNHLKQQSTFEANELQLHEEKKEIHTLSASLEKMNLSLLSLEQSVEQQSTNRRNTQQALMQLVQNENEAKSECKKVRSTIEYQEEKLQQILKTENQYQEELNHLILQANQEDKTLERLSEEFKKEEALYTQIKNQLEEEKGSLEKSQLQSQRVAQQLSETKASKELLKRLKSEMEGYNKATQRLVKDSQKETHPLYQKISLLIDYFKPTKGNEQKISTILQPYLQTIIVESHADLKLLFEYVKKDRLSALSCLCLQDLSPPPEQTEFPLAKLNTVSWHFLSHLHNKEASFESSITEEYYLDPLGVYHFSSQGEENVFLRSLELHEKEKQFEEIQKHHESLMQNIQNLKVSVKALHSEKEEKAQALKQLEIQMNRIENTHTYVKKQKESLVDKLQRYFREKEELKISLKDLQLKEKKLFKTLTDSQKKRADQEQQFKEIEAHFETHFSTLKEQRGLKQSLEDKIRQSEKRAQTLTESIRVFESKSDHFEDQVEKTSRSIEEKENLFEQLNKESEALKQNTEKREAKLLETEKNYKISEEQLEILESNQKKLEQKIKVARESLNQLRNVEIEVMARLSEHQAQISLLKEEMSDKWNWTLQELEEKELSASITLGQTEREIKKLRSLLAAQPEINLKALSECEAEKNRFEFLQTQVKDLKVSQEELLSIITELDESSRTKFQETFEKIRERFKTNFSLLFNGGEADLQLAAHEDLLEAGIEIIAQPPGKKMRSIQLLSGGEKCLCAIALLFALFETQSIPFCILDEIDAPLDDTNIERFTNVLKKFVENHQFIIITHNKRTMAISDQILGISMQEKGVTQVIPLKFDHKPAKEEILT